MRNAATKVRVVARTRQPLGMCCVAKKCLYLKTVFDYIYIYFTNIYIYIYKLYSTSVVNLIFIYIAVAYLICIYLPTGAVLQRPLARDVLPSSQHCDIYQPKDISNTALIFFYRSITFSFMLFKVKY